MKIKILTSIGQDEWFADADDSGATPQGGQESEPIRVLPKATREPPPLPNTVRLRIQQILSNASLSRRQAARSLAETVNELEATCQAWLSRGPDYLWTQIDPHASTP